MVPRQKLDLFIEKVKMRTKRSIMKSGILGKARGERCDLSPSDRESEDED